MLDKFSLYTYFLALFIFFFYSSSLGMFLCNTLLASSSSSLFVCPFEKCISISRSNLSNFSFSFRSSPSISLSPSLFLCFSCSPSLTIICKLYQYTIPFTVKKTKEQKNSDKLYMTYGVEIYVYIYNIYISVYII